MNEIVEFTNLCMVRDGDRVLVIDRKKEDWPGITFPGVMSKRENHLRKQ